VIDAEEPSPPEMSRGSGAFLGIVPDFAYSGTGVGLKGTVPASPAESAGLQDGDVLVAIDGKPIADLRALMHFLAAGKPGDEIEIQIMRGSAPAVKTATLSVRSSRGHSD
jgi:S1-C subfamily serine protease